MTRTPAQKENYQRRMAKIDAAGPVVLEYLREHKDWFIPRHMQSANAISITSTSQVLCSLDHLKDPPRRGYGTVQVMFVADRTVPSDEMRLSILRFPVWDGKIAPGEISLDAHAGEMVAERFQRLAEAEQQ